MSEYFITLLGCRSKCRKPWFLQFFCSSPTSSELVHVERQHSHTATFIFRSCYTCRLKVLVGWVLSCPLCPSGMALNVTGEHRRIPQFLLAHKAATLIHGAGTSLHLPWGSVNGATLVFIYFIFFWIVLLKQLWWLGKQRGKDWSHWLLIWFLTWALRSPESDPWAPLPASQPCSYSVLFIYNTPLDSCDMALLTKLPMKLCQPGKHWHLVVLY